MLNTSWDIIFRLKHCLAGYFDTDSMGCVPFGNHLQPERGRRHLPEKRELPGWIGSVQ